jgi:hypothetical protein
MLTSVGSASTDARTAALRAACELLADSSGIEAVSVSARRLDADGRAPLLLRVAERLASSHDLAVVVRLDRDGFDIRFERQAGGQPDAVGA